jgi:Transposase DDE domain group 1
MTPFGIAVDFWCDGGDGVAIRLWLIALATSTGLRSKGDPNLLGRPGDPELDQFGTTVRPGRLEVLEIDDTFCAAYGGQQLAFWNSNHDERGFAPVHIYHAATGILRPAPTPNGTEVRTIVRHVTKRVRKHWSNTRIARRGDSDYGRTEVMESAEYSGNAYIFSLPGNTVLDDTLVADAADNLRFHHARSNHIKLRTYTSFAAFRDKVRDEGGDGDTGAADAAECNDCLRRAFQPELM